MDEISKDKLSELLSNPESLKALSSIAKNFMSSNNSQEKKPEEYKQHEKQEINPEKDTQTVLSDTQNIPTDNIFGTNKHYNDRLNLLRSIKPYLTDARQTRVDSLVRAINIANLINTYSQNSDKFI